MYIDGGKKIRRYIVYLAEARVARARGVFVTDDRLITRRVQQQQSQSCVRRRFFSTTTIPSTLPAPPPVADYGIKAIKIGI